MHQVINFQQAQNKAQEKQAGAYKKAMLLAQMHTFMNEAENQRKELYERYKTALMSDDKEQMAKLPLEITEAGGKLSAFTKCANLVAINI